MIITKDTFLYFPPGFPSLILRYWSERGEKREFLFTTFGLSKFAVVKGAEFIAQYGGAFTYHILLEKKWQKIWSAPWLTVSKALTVGQI